MEITSTLTQLGQYISEWHRKKYDSLHSKQADKNEQLENNITEIENNISHESNHIKELALYISEKIDGQETNNDDIDEIIQEINSKNDKAINLKGLKIDINNINTIIGEYINNKTVSQRLNTIENNIVSNENIEDKIDESFQGQKISARSNLDAYKKAGIYQCDSVQISTTLGHNPTQSTFNLIVLQHGNGDTHQIIYDNKGEVWIRIYDIQGRWSDWRRLYGEHNTKTLDMEVDFSDNSHATYTILIKEA